MKRTVHLGASTLVSRLLGFIRQILEVRFLGAGPVADAYITAFRIPNSLRKIFAEGALSAAFVPTIVHVFKHEGDMAAARVTSLVLMLMSALVTGLCLIVWAHAQAVIVAIAPGWASTAQACPWWSWLPESLAWVGEWFSQMAPWLEGNIAEGMGSPERIVIAVAFLKILIFYIFFLSTIAVYNGALQARSNFGVTAFSQIFMNVLLIVELAICIYFRLSTRAFAIFVVGNAAINFVLYAWMYQRQGSALFLMPKRDTWNHARTVFVKFLPCLISVGAIEINLFIDQMLASYLPTGSIALIHYSSSFMRIPVSVFAVAFSTVLLPHVSRVTTYAPKRLSFYLLESAQLVWWLTIPVTALMIFFARDIFVTIMVSERFSLENGIISAQLLSILASGLFFLSLNKVMLSLFYARGSTLAPTLLTLVGTALNTILNCIFMCRWGVHGLVLATVVATACQTIFYVMALNSVCGIRLYPSRFTLFAARSLIQFLAITVPWYACYSVVRWVVLSLKLHAFFMVSYGYWLWISPLVLGYILTLYLSRHYFGIKLHFIDL